MEADSGIRIGELRVDGSAVANNLLMQFQADMLGVDVVRPQISEPLRSVRRIWPGWQSVTGKT
ncbi:MAG: Glycerol kinase (EC [uncultured Caballeronia sp.]|nr:MAG: Glycerol kinase (EC [uncultured Caballeronia sp.]